MESTGRHWERACPRCGQQLTKPHSNDPWACWVCGWGDYVNAEKRGEREFDNR
jgi:ribosomal protein S27AE